MTPQGFYLASNVAWFLAFGLQIVLIAYLAASVLKLSPIMVGIVQASVQLPSVLLLLFAGSVADQIDNRRLMLLAHAAMIVPAFALGFAIALGSLDVPHLLLYGLAAGTVTAFMMPAREAMLARVVTSSEAGAIQAAVSLSLITQFAGQLSGMLAARAADGVGVPAMFGVLALLQAFGAYAVFRLPISHAQPSKHATLREHVGRVGQGLNEVWQSRALLPVTIVALAIGVFFVGSFMVILPLILREEFGGNVQQFSTLQVAFWGGTITSAIAMARLGPIHRKGRLIVIAISAGAVILAAIGIPGLLWLLYLLVFTWGLGAGVTISMARTIVQEEAPAPSRARIMAVYQFGFTGGMPIGALLAGPLVAAVGHREAALIPAVAMALVIVALLLRTEIWRLESARHL